MVKPSQKESGIQRSLGEMGRPDTLYVGAPILCKRMSGGLLEKGEAVKFPLEPEEALI